jgi:hypothetical protein
LVRRVSETSRFRPSAFSCLRSWSAALVTIACQRASLPGEMLILRPSGAGPAALRMSARSWVSHGTSGRSGERSLGLVGFVPISGALVRKNWSVPIG